MLYLPFSQDNTFIEIYELYFQKPLSDSQKYLFDKNNFKGPMNNGRGLKASN